MARHGKARFFMKYVIFWHGLAPHGEVGNGEARCG